MTNKESIIKALGISERAYGMVSEAEEALKDVFGRMAENESANFARVLAAFMEENVALGHFAPTTGYGYDDVGRDTLDRLFAKALMAEAALVRPQIASGTHALYLSISGLTEHGDSIVSATGVPYDTMETAIFSDAPSSLKRQGVSFFPVELNGDGSIAISAVCEAIERHRPKLMYVQRSRGYAWRNSLLPERDMRALFSIVHEKYPNVIIFVDNCYGEFTGTQEPVSVGADVMAGSLIKNAGGGIAPTGGYIAGGKRHIDSIAQRLTVPGMGAEVGSYAGSYRPFYQGLFNAPHVTSQALMSAALFARVFASLGFEVTPEYDAERSDIVEAIRFRDADSLISFVRSVQRVSPVDSGAVPEPWDMPGYTSKVIMAAGAFVQGASIELSADAPIREPYTAYVQGALNYAHGRIAAMSIVDSLIKSGKIN